MIGKAQSLLCSREPRRGPSAISGARAGNFEIHEEHSLSRLFQVPLLLNLFRDKLKTHQQANTFLDLYANLTFFYLNIQYCFIRHSLEK